MTLAVAAIFSLTCLPLVGVSVHSQMAYGKGPEEDILIGVNLNNVPFIKSMKGASGSRVTYPEKCCFTSCGYADFWPAPPPNASYKIIFQLLEL